MGRPKIKTCGLCYKTMRGDNLERHIKTHKIKQKLRDEAESSSSDAFVEKKHIDEVENPRYGACEQMKNVLRYGACEQMKKIDEDGTNRMETSSEKCTNLEMLEKNVRSYVDEFNRKIEIGRNLKIIINKHGFNTHALPENMKEALKTYELYGKNMDMEEINWRGTVKSFWKVDG